jgi:6-hydroxycyclohex-1-ene-1-carbonyl-CoA dehydrogenase
VKVTAFEMRAPNAPLQRVEREIGTIPAGHALVEVAGCGVCHTDLAFLYEGVQTRHPLPLVLGHEIAGIVRQAGPEARALTGRAVVVPAVIPCGTCVLCRAGRREICRSQVFPGNDVDGGFASHVVVPSAGLCPLPSTISSPREIARYSVCADAVSTAYAAIKKSGLRSGDFAIFVGAGGVGSFGIQIAQALGARVLAIDVAPERLALVSQHGASWTLDARECPGRELRTKARAIAKEAGLPPTEWKIFETSGTGAGQEAAFGLLTFGAYLGIVGFHPADVTVRLSNLMAFAARAEGTWGCPPELFPEILDLILSGAVALDPFIELHPMSRINEVLTALHRHELRRRPVLLPDFSS